MTAPKKEKSRSNEKAGHRPLSECLRLATQGLHIEAERTGFIGDLLRRRGRRLGYALLLRNLLPLYEAMESGLERHAGTRGLRAVVRPELYRSAALRSDLVALSGEEWILQLPLLEAGLKYASLAAGAAENKGTGLIAHAYVRYLGDLSGGQILKKTLSQSLQLGGLRFHDFAAIDDIEEFKDGYRSAFDLAGKELKVDERERVIEEAQNAFRANIALSLEIQSYLGRNGR